MLVVIKNVTGTNYRFPSVGLVVANKTIQFDAEYRQLEKIGRDLKAQVLAGNVFWWTSDCEMDLRWFGVVPDGSTDSTTFLQAAFNNAKVAIDDQYPVTLYLPPGITKITSTVVMYGNSAMSPAFVGQDSITNYSNTGQSSLKWFGADGGTLFFTQGINNAVIKNITFDGNSSAKYCVHFSASLFSNPATLAASNNTLCWGCTFQHVKVGTATYGTVALGTDPALTGGNTYEFATGAFEHCSFVPEDPGAPGFSFSGMQAFAVKNLSGGNAKIFSYVDCAFSFCRAGIDNNFGSAQVCVYNFQMGDVIYPFIHGSGELIIDGGDCEGGDLSDSQLLTGTTQAGSYCQMNGVEFVNFMAGSTGTAAVYAGYFYMTGSYMRNGNSSVSGNPNIPNPFKLIVADSFGATQGSFRSEANWYYNCGAASNGFIPIFDGSSNALWPQIDTFGADHAFNLSSKDDLGGLAAGPTHLGNFTSDDQTFYSVRFNGPTAWMELTQTVNGAQTIADQAQVFNWDPNALTTANLPTVVGKRGRWYTFKKANATTNNIVLTPFGGETIDGASTYTLKGAYSCVTIYADGTSNWSILGRQFAKTDGNFVVDGQLGVNIDPPAYRFQVSGTAVGGALAAVSGQSLGSGDIQLYLPGPTLTGNFTHWIDGGASVTGTLGATMQNANSTSGTADAKWSIVTTSGTGGDPYVEYTISGVRSWTTGVDNSDSDQFKINGNGSPGSGGTDWLIIHPTTGVVTTPSGVRPLADLGASLGSATLRWTSLFGATLKDGNSVNRMLFVTGQGNVYVDDIASPSGTDVAHIFNTTAAYSAAGSKLAQWLNSSSEKVFFTKDGGGFFNSKLGVGQNTPDGQLDVSQTNLPNSATAIVTTNASVTGNNIVGIYSDVEISGTYASSGGHDQAIAIEGDVYHHGSGNLNFVTGVAGYFQSDGSGTIGQGRVLSSLAPSITGGTVTELSGLYMEEMTGATTNYAIKYTHGTNPFTLTGPGKVGIGTLTANAQLSINAAGSAGDNLFIQGPTASSYLELFDTVESDWEVTKTNGDKVVPLYTAAISNPTSPAANEAVSHYADAFHGGTSSIPLIGAVAGYCENNGTGTTTVAIPLRARAVVNSGGGAITEVIGLQLEQQTVGGTNWALKHGTTSDNHFFAFKGDGVPAFSFTDGSGTPGNQTINKTTGKAALASGASSVTITDDRITANSIVQIQIEGASFDATATRFQVTYGSGNFVVHSNAAATGNVVFNWRICN